MFKIIKIIGGEKRGFPLKTKEGTSTRPTLHRIRENVSNILQSVIPGSVGLDLFAGSGAVGIEALSRGAQMVTFVEKDKVALGVIKDNLSKTNFNDKSTVFPSSWHIFLKNTTDVFDWIYVDPPYGLNVYHDVLKAIGKVKCLAQGGIVIFETDKKVRMQEEVDGFICYRHIGYGSTIIWFYKEI